MTIKKSNNENNFRNHFTSVFRCVCISSSIYVHHSIAIKKLLYTARYWFLMLKLIIVNLNARISSEIVLLRMYENLHGIIYYYYHHY